MSEERHIKIGSGDYRETHVSYQAIYVEGDYYNNPEQRQSLAEVAAEIQKLLEQLDKTYSSNTTTGKMKIATEVVEHIDCNPTMTNRIISALQAGSVSALDSLLDHPAASFVISALEDWQQSKQS